MNTEKGTETTRQKKAGQHNTAFTVAISALLMAGTIGVAIATQDITAAEAEQINAMLAPVANPQANAEKVGSVPEDPAVLVGSQFSYQGTLRLSGDRANGPYDFRFKLYNQFTGGSLIATTNTVDNLMVTDGLFATDLMFGEPPIDGDDIFLQIEVRDGASTGAYTVLSPRQRINATPYAVRALHGGDGGSSPWMVTGTIISYTAGRVGVGTTAPLAQLHVNAPAGEDAIRVQVNNDTQFIVKADGKVGIGPSNPQAPLHVSSGGINPVRIEGGDQAYMSFFENGNFRGYMGSFQTGTGNFMDADFEIGTPGANSTGNMHIVTQQTPRITVLANGNVGIPGSVGNAQLTVSAEANETSLRVQNGFTDRLVVKGDGNTKVYGDLEQPVGSGGAVKAAVYIVACGGTPGPTGVTRQFNGVNTGTITASNNASGQCTIHFPFPVGTRFWTASAVHGPSITGGRSAGCYHDSNNTNDLVCERRNMSSASLSSGPLMAVVY